jgi:hypothetical protein
MNILELQLSILFSGVPESGSGPTLLDDVAPGLDTRAGESPDRATAMLPAADDESGRPV